MSIKKSFYNSFFGIIAMLTIGLITFVKISFIINIIGQEYNGLNNLYTQIFSFLMIGQAGIGLATTSMLYEYIEKKNIKEINKIISGSRRILSEILCILFLIVIVISPFIRILIKDNIFNNYFVSITFILFSFKILFSQYFQPLKGFVAANQDEYIVQIFQIVLNLSVGILEISVLYLSKSYVKMILSGVILSIVLELFNYMYLKQRYSKILYFFKEKNYGAKKHIKELVKVNIVSTIAKSMDPLLISKILGLIVTSLYSNYNYVQSFLLAIAGAGLGGFRHYFGSVFIKRDAQRKEKFDKYILISNFIATFFALMFYLMIEDFIILWINQESKLDSTTSLLFSILIYLYVLMKPINTLVITNKLFHLASKSSLYEAIINLFISLILIQKIGLNGVLIGSISSFLLVSFWYFPINTYKKILDCSSKDYFYKQFKCFFILIVLFLLILKFSQIYSYVSNSWFQFIMKGVVYSISCFSVILVTYLSLFKEIKKYRK